MENKQTAVNWLIKNLMLNGLIRLTQDQHSLYKELTEEAKQMEKEQIIDALSYCIEQEYYNKTYANCESVSLQAQEYYLDIFKQNTND